MYVLYIYIYIYLHRGRREKYLPEAAAKGRRLEGWPEGLSFPGFLYIYIYISLIYKLYLHFLKFLSVLLISTYISLPSTYMSFICYLVPLLST